MKIEKIGNRYRVKHKIGFYLYGNTKEEVLHKIAILKNMIAKELSKETTMAEEIKKIADLDIGDFVTDGDEWAEVKQSSESGAYIDDKYYAYRGQLNDGTLEQFEVELNQLIAVNDFHKGNEVEDE